MRIDREYESFFRGMMNQFIAQRNKYTPRSCDVSAIRSDDRIESDNFNCSFSDLHSGQIHSGFAKRGLPIIQWRGG